LFQERGIADSDIRDLLANTPAIGRGILDLYQAYRKAKEDTQVLAERLSDDELVFGLEGNRQPSEEVSDVIQSHLNCFPTLEEAASELRAELGTDARDLQGRLIEYLARRHDVTVEIVQSDRRTGAVRKFVRAERRLVLSDMLPGTSVTFQLAHQLGLLAARERFDEIIGGAALRSEESKRLGLVALSNYFAGALIMPYDVFLAAARSVRYDVELLEHRFQSSFEQVCHRLTSLNRPGSEGVPFHLVRVDIAGNISKRFSASGIPFARYSGACPRWNVHAAFMTPGSIRTQISRMTDGTSYFSIARTVRKAGGGHRVRQNRFALELGCEVKHARELVYSDGLDLENRDASVPVGVTCRLCDRMDCRQRAFPPMHHKLNVDENVRGLSFYYSPGNA
jgi:predicted transcriptional regulator